MPKPKFTPLGVPPAALEEGGMEILRVAVVNGGLQMSLLRAFDDPALWGLAICDLTRHVARIFARETKMTEEEAIAKIRHMFNAEMDMPTDPGTTQARN
jgi:hypothetical protein